MECYPLTGEATIRCAVISSSHDVHMMFNGCAHWIEGHIIAHTKIHNNYVPHTITITTYLKLLRSTYNRGEGFWVF